MNWTDVFTVVNFDNGDYLEEIKLDGWKNNFAFLRERASYVQAMGGLSGFVTFGSGSSGTLTLSVDGTGIGTTSSFSSGVWTVDKLVDKAISGYADGLHDVSFGSVQAKIIKPPEMDYLSAFFSRRYVVAGGGSGGDAEFRYLTVVLHREVQGW